MGNATFAAVLRQHREAASLSVQELAARVGLTRQAIYLLEAGKREPTLDAVLRLAAGLGVNRCKLIRDLPTPPGTNAS
jgi:transcriptional regulator with XRE-family HTH domain